MTQITLIDKYEAQPIVIDYELIATLINGGNMKKKPLVSKPTNIHSLRFEDLYEELSHNWEFKAKQLQDRRWKLLKRSLKEDKYYGRNYKNEY